jgi:outer membrane lipoprotein
MPWRRYWQPIALLSLIALMLLGCAHAVSEQLRQQATPPIPFPQLQANPEVYKDRLVILGGTILETRNTEEGTVLEVLQKPLSGAERPLLTDQTAGRFMALCNMYLDPAVYTKNRDITVAGRILGSRSGQIGEAAYVYPLVSCLELRLWPQVVAVDGAPYYYPPYGRPWYWYSYPRFRFYLSH